MRVHSRGTSPPSARRCQAPHTFRPRGFPPPRRLAPRIGSRVCCTPQPVLGFAAFRARGPPRGAEPFEGFPSSTAVPRHRGRVPPCRYRRDVEPCSRGRRRFEAEATNHRVEAPVCRSRPPRRPARARCEHPRHRRGRSTYRGTRDNRGEPSHQEERAALHQVTGGHGRRSGRAARCAVANAGEPAGGRASSSKHLAKRPTSRPCSADESVASHRRCQRGDTRSFHGFCPLQGPRRAAPERRCRAERGSRPGFADRDRSLGGARRVCPVAGSNRRDRARRAGGTDLHGVSDVNDRPEERVFGRTRTLPGAGWHLEGSGTSLQSVWRLTDSDPIRRPGRQLPWGWRGLQGLPDGAPRRVVVRAIDPVAARMAFAAPSVVFRAEAPDLRGFPAPTAVPWRKRRGPPALLTFASPSERSSERWSRSSSSRGIRRRPSTDMTEARPLPGDESPIGAALPGAALVPSTWFPTTSTASSAHRLAGLLRPAAGPGVRRVSGRDPPRDAEPFEGFPSSTAVPRHRGRCPPAVTGEMSRSRGRGQGTRSKLRSAEADPHVDPHARGARPHDTAEVGARTGVRATTTTNEPPGRAGSAPPDHRRARSPKRPGCPVRRRERRRTCERTGELVETSREAARLRGLAPPTSPLRHTAVASGATLDPSMGFVPSKVPDRPLPNGECHAEGDPSLGSPTGTEVSEAPGESVR
jgi:hypothetical protein